MNGKRRAGHVDSPELSTPDPPQKRIRKRNDDTYFPDVETVDSTQELGTKIISLLKRSQDKNGRLIATEFLDLPERSLYPDYYEQIPLPMSITVIEKKLSRGEYASMTALESDLKRMVQNAKDYNSSKSEIFEDAERIRKALSNFMPKHNPAYQDPEYRAVPTPIPDHVVRSAPREASATASEHSTIKLRLNTGGRPRSAAPSDPPAIPTPDEDMTQAQLDILDQLSVQDDAINFEHKPSRRDYGDYYRIIKQPTSINDVRKSVQQGKVKSWEDFAREVRLIWTNAKEYNEPTSTIYSMTERLETWTEDKLKAHGVAPKVVTKLSLKTQPPPSLKLKVGTPAPATTGSGYTVDQSALDRQKSELASALNRARDGSEVTSTPVPPVPSSLRRSISVVDPGVPMTGTNGTAATPLIPSRPSVPPPGPAHLPAPTLEGELPRQELKSSLQPPLAPLTNGYHAPPRSQPQVPTSNIFAESSNPIDRKFRDPNKSSADALLPSITYMTSPLLVSDPHRKITRFAHPQKTQTSYYTYLPSTHSALRVVPELHLDLKQGRRKYKLFVLNNNTVVPASPDVAGQGVYDLQLMLGENVITVEAISALQDGERKEYARDWEQFDFERVTFYVYLRPQGL
ncbi:hypothetical protein LTR51_006765 [Lithohypha guttulata]|nr:hypothetical protein LTR51_006765 [Lithohypha guttulata]